MDYEKLLVRDGVRIENFLKFGERVELGIRIFYFDFIIMNENMMFYFVI